MYFHTAQSSPAR
ncbi:hypothetical protein FQN60_016524 [Etheostoma spectabile]|uniref:Uncharacterized protein n=1 Tax=Etheostoma spectabile TaxID=54343 RepID=A0A5J5CZ67_9PERO|nr:hypothetical protein FQN60_016524 [Etheostoma spectabile]